RKEQTHKSRTGKVLKRYHWVGNYCDRGINYTLYIGKELPKELERLLEGRVLNPRTGHYWWPDSRHNPDRLDTLRFQEETKGRFKMVKYHGKEV
ncbi:unnamed protein product, partial [marine sediment metagenome]